MMATFDYPEMGPNCVSRSTSTVSPQSLMLMNNNRVRELAKAMSERVARETTGGVREKVDSVFQIALSRSPGESELNLGAETLMLLEKESPDGALETFCHAVLNSAGFIYID